MPTTNLAEVLLLMVAGISLFALLSFVAKFLNHLASRRRLKKGTRILPTVALLIVSTTCVNQLCCYAIEYSIGGSALKGRAENGHYYVRYRSRLTPVSEACFKTMEVYESISSVLFYAGFFVGIVARATKPKAKPTLSWRDE
jgi:hypothetical protein